MECSSCLEVFEPSNKYICTLNHEVLCVTCLKRWVSIRNHPTCPICRSSYKEIPNNISNLVNEPKKQPIPIADLNHFLSNLVIETRQQIIPYNEEDHRELFSFKMFAMGYSRELIEEWCSYI